MNKHMKKRRMIQHSWSKQTNNLFLLTVLWSVIYYKPTQSSISIRQVALFRQYFIYLMWNDNIYLKKQAYALTSVLQACSNTLHGQDQGVFKTRSIFTCGVKLYKLCSWLAWFHVFFWQLRPNLHMIVGVTDPF